MGYDRRMSINCVLTGVFALLAIAGGASGRQLRVPTEYPSIQLAIDAVQEFDTLLIECGTYVESVTAPSVSFMMLGEACPDTSSFTGPTIDATVIPGADTTAVLTIPESVRVRIENIRFLNEDRVGISTLSDSLTMLGCAFENTNYGVSQERHDQGAVIILQECTFVECGFACVRGRLGNALLASRCQFTGNG